LASESLTMKVKIIQMIKNPIVNVHFGFFIPESPFSSCC